MDYKVQKSTDFTEYFKILINYF